MKYRKPTGLEEKVLVVLYSYGSEQWKQSERVDPVEEELPPSLYMEEAELLEALAP